MVFACAVNTIYILQLTKVVKLMSAISAYDQIMSKVFMTYNTANVLFSKIQFIFVLKNYSTI